MAPGASRRAAEQSAAKLLEAAQAVSPATKAARKSGKARAQLSLPWQWPKTK